MDNQVKSLFLTWHISFCKLSVARKKGVLWWLLNISMSAPFSNKYNTMSCEPIISKKTERANKPTATWQLNINRSSTAVLFVSFCDLKYSWSKFTHRAWFVTVTGSAKEFESSRNLAAAVQRREEKFCKSKRDRYLQNVRACRPCAELYCQTHALWTWWSPCLH